MTHPAGRSSDGGPLRIEMVVPSLDVAGLEMVVYNLVHVLACDGHDVGVSCIERRGTLGDRLVAEGHRVTVVPTPGLRTNLAPSALAAWFRESRPDVVHVHSGAWMKAVRAARLAGVRRSVYTLHGIWPQPPWFIPSYSWIAGRWTDQIVAVSHSLREHAIHEFHIRPSRVCVIENGIDTDHFSPGPASGALRRALAIPASARIIGTVARLHPVKNHAMLIDAFESLHRSRPDTALVIVGEGPLREALERQVAERSLGGAVFLPGASDNIVDYLREFDLFVLPSIIEGTSISALEAMSCGLCVLATAVGGNPKLLGGNRFGVLAPPEDSEAFADAMRSLIDSDDRRMAIGAAARARAVEHHAHTAVARAYVDIYRG